MERRLGARQLFSCDEDGRGGRSLTNLDGRKIRHPKRTYYYCPGSSTSRADNARDTSVKRIPEIL